MRAVPWTATNKWRREQRRRLCRIERTLLLSDDFTLCPPSLSPEKRGPPRASVYIPLAFSSTKQHNSFSGGISCPARYSWSPITSLQRIQYCREGKLKWYSSVNNPAVHCAYIMGFLTERETISQGPAAHLPPDEEERTQRLILWRPPDTPDPQTKITKVVPECRSILPVFLSEQFRLLLQP